MLEQPVADVLDIERAFLHIFVVQQVEHRDEMVDRFLDGHFRRFVLPLDNALNFVHEHRIVQNGQMRVEDTSFLPRRRPRRSSVLHLLDFGFGSADAFIQPFEFLGQIGHVDFLIRQAPTPSAAGRTLCRSRCLLMPLMP